MSDYSKSGLIPWAEYHRVGRNFGFNHLQLIQFTFFLLCLSLISVCLFTIRNLIVFVEINSHVLLHDLSYQRDSGFGAPYVIVSAQYRLRVHYSLTILLLQSLYRSPFSPNLCRDFLNLCRYARWLRRLGVRLD
jgi:hypothetical protein